MGGMFFPFWVDGNNFGMTRKTYRRDSKATLLWWLNRDTHLQNICTSIWESFCQTFGTNIQNTSLNNQHQDGFLDSHGLIIVHLDEWRKNMFHQLGFLTEIAKGIPFLVTTIYKIWLVASDMAMNIT